MAGHTIADVVGGAPIAEYFESGMAATERGDYSTALRQFLPLADQGHADAQFNLGAMYREGRGVLIDYAEAMKWFRLAADQGHGRAQTTVGNMYREGWGVPRDCAEAVRWYRLAAEQRESYAQSNLSSVYFNGEGAPQDRVLAYMWSHLAAAQDHVAGAEKRDLFGEEMTRDQIAEAKRLAREWKPKSERQ